MKTLGRILVILAAFAIVMGITYLVVNSGSSSSIAGPAFERGSESVSRPPGGLELSGGEGRGGGWVFGALKNIGIIAIIVMIITWPKGLFRERKRISQN